MSNILDLREKLEQLARQSAVEEAERRREIGRRAEDYVHRYVSLIALTLGLCAVMMAIAGLAVMGRI